MIYNILYNCTVVLILLDMAMNYILKGYIGIVILYMIKEICIIPSKIYGYVLTCKVYWIISSWLLIFKWWIALRPNILYLVYNIIRITIVVICYIKHGYLDTSVQDTLMFLYYYFIAELDFIGPIYNYYDIKLNSSDEVWDGMVYMPSHYPLGPNGIYPYKGGPGGSGPNGPNDPSNPHWKPGRTLKDDEDIYGYNKDKFPTVKIPQYTEIEKISRLQQKALVDAGVEPSDVRYFNHLLDVIQQNYKDMHNRNIIPAKRTLGGTELKEVEITYVASKFVTWSVVNNGTPNIEGPKNTERSDILGARIKLGGVLDAFVRPKTPNQYRDP